MDTKVTGGPAHPVIWGEQIMVEPGMTLLDHFAGLAMQATLHAVAGWGPVEFSKDVDVDAAAEFAYKQAAAMIRVRQRDEPVYENVRECQYGNTFPCNPACDDSGSCYTREVAQS